MILRLPNGYLYIPKIVLNAKCLSKKMVGVITWVAKTSLVHFSSVGFVWKNGVAARMIATGMYIFRCFLVLPRIYILSLRHYLACRGMKPMMNFFFQGWTFFSPRPKGGQLFSWGRRPRLNRLTGGQGKKRSPTKETKSSSKVSVSSTAAKYHVLEDRYIFLLNYHMSNQAF